MSLDVTVNINSLQMIREELVSTIVQSASDFESYMADQQNSGHITDSSAGIKQIGGTFRLLQYPGAALLADEMAVLLQRIDDSQSSPSDSMINALTNAFFLLPRYIEYVISRGSALPILLIPAVNDLRIASKQALLPEHHFVNTDLTTTAGNIASLGSNRVGELLTSIGRLRHMYQAGLLGVINQQNPGAHYYQFMSRSIARTASMLSGHDSQISWRLAGAVLECFSNNALELTINRKRNLADIEKKLRQVVSKGEEGLNEPFPEPLIKDMLFLLLLSSHQSTEIQAVRDAYSQPNSLDMDDNAIAHQREVMYGPSMDTFESVIAVLQRGTLPG